MTDTERLDWLSAQPSASFSAVNPPSKLLPNSHDHQSIMWRGGMRVQLFTVASQHVYGTDMRNVIDVAMTKVRLVGAAP